MGRYWYEVIIKELKYLGSGKKKGNKYYCAKDRGSVLVFDGQYFIRHLAPMQAREVMELGKRLDLDKNNQVEHNYNKAISK